MKGKLADCADSRSPIARACALAEAEKNSGVKDKGTRAYNSTVVCAGSLMA